MVGANSAAAAAATRILRMIDHTPDVDGCQSVTRPVVTVYNRTSPGCDANGIQGLSRSDGDRAGPGAAAWGWGAFYTTRAAVGAVIGGAFGYLMAR